MSTDGVARVDIRRLRLEKRFAQRDVARLAGLTVSALARLERGYDALSPETARSLGRALGADLDGLEARAPVAGEGYVTAVPAAETVRPRRRPHDIALRPVVDLF